MKIHHIGYLVKKIEKAKTEFERLGFSVENDICYDEKRDVDICFLVKDGYRVELVSPKSENSVVYGLYKKLGNTPYHICYEADSFELDIQNLRDNGYVICNEEAPAVAIEGRRVCFLINANLGMIEILE